MSIQTLNQRLVIKRRGFVTLSYLEALTKPNLQISTNSPRLNVGVWSYYSCRYLMETVRFLNTE
nr:hypothetical protein [uncultured Emticicia sp.]